MEKKKNKFWKNGHPRGMLGKIPWNKGLKTGLVPKTAFKKNTGLKLGMVKHFARSVI